MTAQPADLYELLKKIRYDATAIQAKITDALKLLGELNLPEQPQVECPNCGLPFKGTRTLAEHMHTSHGWPIPEHWAQLDERIDQPADEAPASVS